MYIEPEEVELGLEHKVKRTRLYRSVLGEFFGAAWLFGGEDRLR